jgi:deoxyhypusine synthase
LSDESIAPDESEDLIDPTVRSNTRCLVLLGYTSNLVSSGLREVIRFLVQHSYVSGIVTTAGGIEEDLIKCLGPTYLAPEGRFDHDGAGLRKRGLNRIGNLIVPNDNYCKFEDWVTPILDQLVREQSEKGVTWTPSTVIERLGREIDNEESILYWASKVWPRANEFTLVSVRLLNWIMSSTQNGIPVFCPALTDGSFGDMLWGHSYKTEIPLAIDIVADIRRLNDLSMRAKKAGMVILGGGVCKHQIANSMLFVRLLFLSFFSSLVESGFSDDYGP